MTDHTLLPCPFCGGEGEITPHVHDHALKAVVCDECSSSSGWYLHEEEAIAAWNRRTPPAAGPEPWGWLCNGKGDGWEERDKVVRDPELIARYRERPDLWRIEPLYLGSQPAAVPDGWRDALEHVTELLVDTWHHQMDGDPEEQIAVKDARALLATLPLSVPEDWVLVPKEPTPEMLDAATPPESEWISHKLAKPGSFERWRQGHRKEAARKYRSMISAAPAAPTEARDE